MKICNPVTNGQDRDSRTLIVQLNEKLTSSGIKNVVHAFSLGCVISIVLIGFSLLVFYLFGMRSKVGIGLSAIIAMLLATMISRYLANHVCSNTITLANKVEVEQQILQNMDDHNHEPGAFQRIAEQILPSNAPPMNYLAVTSSKTDL